MKKMHKVATGLVVLSFAMLPMTSLAAEKTIPAKAPAKVEAPAKTQPTAPKVVKSSHKVKHHRGGMSHEKAMAVQKALNAHGAHLKVDGKFGKTSRQVLEKFQKENGLKATGRLNKKTLAKLQTAGK